MINKGTALKEIKVKSVLNKHRKRDSWFLDDYSVNPYVGCSFNCIYCYIRGSRYGGNRVGEIFVKTNAPEVLEKQLKRRAAKGDYGIILFSSSTEAYLPVERELRLTRQLLEVILKYRFPVHVITKSDLVLRDLDLLKEIDKAAILPEDLKSKLKRGVIISFSVSTVDERLAKIFEPGAPEPRIRLEAVKKCREEDFLVGVDFIPVLPYLSDTVEDLDRMIGMAREYGASFVLVGALTLFGKNSFDCKMLYYKALRKHFPDLISKYESLFRDSFTPSKRYQRNLEERAVRICRRYKIRYKIV